MSPRRQVTDVHTKPDFPRGLKLVFRTAKATHCAVGKDLAVKVRPKAGGGGLLEGGLSILDMNHSSSCSTFKPLTKTPLRVPLLILEITERNKSNITNPLKHRSNRFSDVELWGGSNKSALTPPPPKKHPNHFQAYITFKHKI